MTAFISKPKMAELWFGCLEYYPCIQKWQYIQWMLMCGVGEKPVAHLMKFHLLQWELAKRKFLMNSNMTLTVLDLHQQTDPKVQQDFKGQYSKVKGQSVLHHDVAHLKPSTNVPTKYKLPTPYSLWDITWTRFYRSRSLQQGQRSNQGHMT